MTTPTIIIDTREQKPLPIEGVERVNTVERTLEHGDYAIEGFEDTFAIERKSLNDLSTCCGSDRGRFQEQVKQAADNLDKYGVVIDCERWKLYDFENQSSCPHYYSNISPNSVIGTIEDWPDSYQFEGFRWSGNRTNAAAEVVEKLIEWRTEVILS